MRTINGKVNPWFRLDIAAILAVIMVLSISIIMGEYHKNQNNEDEVKEENIVYLPENTIIKQVYVIGSKEIYLLYDPIQNTYEKCHLENGELITEIIFIQN